MNQLVHEFGRRESIGGLYKRIKFRHLFVFFILCRIPYLITLYPGSMLYDSASSIAQFYGIATHTQSVTAASELLYTDHHLILFTFFMGGFIKLGELLGSQNLGFFLYILLQMAVSNLIFSYFLTTIQDEVSPAGFWFAVLLYALLPHISLWQLTMSKDSCFSAFVLLFCCCVYRALRTDSVSAPDRRLKFLLYLCALLCCFTKHQGAYLIIAVSVVFLIAYRKRHLRMAAILMLMGIFYLTVYSNLILPLCQVSKTGKQEALGFMFQQTARYVVDHPDDITEGERQAIDHILPYDRLAELYDPGLQDPVKFEYNQSASREDLSNYLRAWFSMFFRHPASYFNASLDVFGDYFRAFGHSMLYCLTPIQDNSIVRANPVLDLYNTASQSDLDALGQGLSRLASLPALHFFFCYPCFSWSFVAFFLILLFRKKTAAVVALTPVALSLCILLISPDLEYRYFLPITYAWPVTAALALAPGGHGIAGVPSAGKKRKWLCLAAAVTGTLLLFVFCREVDPTVVNSIRVPAVVYSDEPVRFTVETSAGAKHLFLYAEDGSNAGSWHARPANSRVSGGVRLWTVEKFFYKPGDRTITFRAGETATPTDSSKSVQFSLRDASAVIGVDAGDDVAKGTEMTFTVETTPVANYLMMYMENGDLVKQWKADELNSTVEGDKRIWTVRYAFAAPGQRVMSFKTGMTPTPTDCSMTICFTVF